MDAGCDEAFSHPGHTFRGKGAWSEREIVVAEGRRVRDRDAIPAQGSGQGEGAVDHLGGVLADQVAVVHALSVFVAEEVGVLGDERHLREVSGVFEHVEDGELGRVQDVDEREARGGVATSRATLRHAVHRFFPTGRLAVAAGTWNTSK